MSSSNTLLYLRAFYREYIVLQYKWHIWQYSCHILWPLWLYRLTKTHEIHICLIWKLHCYKSPPYHGLHLMFFERPTCDVYYLNADKFWVSMSSTSEWITDLMPSPPKAYFQKRKIGERFPRHRGLAIPTCITARGRRACRDAYRDR